VRYSPAVRERAVRLFLETEGEHESRWAAIQAVAGKIGCVPETLGKWVLRAGQLEIPAEQQRLADKARIRELERENHELREANEIIRKAAAFFAQAELGRPRR
jgi:transposase